MTINNLQKKLSELHILGDRIRRYQKRLLAEAISRAKERGLVSQIMDLDNLPTDVVCGLSSEVIPLYKEGQYVNTEILLKLSKEKMPSLYRRYQESQRKYLEDLEDLRRIMQ